MHRLNNLLGLICVGGILVGCTILPAPPDQAATPFAKPISADAVTISFGAMDFERSTYEPLIDAFEAQNPGIRVRFVALDDTFGRQSDPELRLREVASAADTALVDTETLIQADNLSAILRDLAPLMQANPSFDRADFFPGALFEETQSGAVYGLQRGVEVRLLAYNKDLFRLRGAPEPALEWTWEDVLATAERLAQQNGDQITTYGLLGEWGKSDEATIALLASAGIDPRDDPAQIDLETPAAAAALEQLAAMRRSGALYVRPPTDDGSVSTSEFEPLIRDQQVGIWPATMSLASPQLLPFEIGFAPFPPLPFFNNGQTYVLSNGTQHPKAAWRWLNFVSSQEVDAAASNGIRRATLAPARRSLVEQNDYFAGLDDETGIPGAAAAVRWALEHPSPRGRYNFPLTQAIGVGVQAILAEGRTPEEALTEAQVQLEEQLAVAAQKPQATAFTAPIVVATPVPEPAAPEGAAVITVRVAENEVRQFTNLAETFTEDNPLIIVRVEPVVFSSELAPGGSTMTLYEPGDQAARSDCFAWGS
ncbi:MAG: extracellular solute-binding protein, partial [Chloroflexales bacterium]|nr:extracellular solute-binding protein [Chloroflexales bacterium]